MYLSSYLLAVCLCLGILLWLVEVKSRVHVFAFYATAYLWSETSSSNIYYMWYFYIDARDKNEYKGNRKVL